MKVRDKMQLVINIDDKLYEIIKNPKKLETMYHAGRLCEAVRNGTPLPKGHGRLIDADKLEYIKNDRPDEIGYHYVRKYNIDYAPTIIEADKINKK